MALLALLTRDSDVEAAARRTLEPRHAVARVGAWERFLLTLRERPVSAAVVDEAYLPAGTPPPGAVSELRARFPSMGVVWLSRPSPDPMALLRLGRAGIHRLVLTAVDDVGSDLPRRVSEAMGEGTEAMVVRAASPYLPARSLTALRVALDGVHRRLSADQFAGVLSLSRPHLSVCLRSSGLPSAGHLLVWARLLHAGRWLGDPGRSAQSVSRQLEYSSGAAFRRALRAYVGLTPGQVADSGGLQAVLGPFLEYCGLPRPGAGRTAA